ncbi:hypothetical protein K458DRAFT_380438 [Lentithecium fluviatile CBS 122367]|uniref:Uncharacterized protein n=1 Tax=Lentithecium fluviatile CBS 122367 TaxID=1168545 RepID=A0A6G1IDN6_9PLEO|nr:hypothetical protein K458DRAFT_380438 [Lentithecium fluviatile CBS 122367]
MLAPRASSAFVCFRCELQLVRPQFRLLPRHSSTLHAHLSTSARRHDAFDDEATRPQSSRPRPQLSEHPLGRLRKRKGNAPLRATTARLEGGVKTLGDDAEILVLKEVGGDGPSEDSVAPEPEVVPATPQEVVNLAASLQQERNPVSPSEIVQQLDSLRPETAGAPDEPRYVSQTTFVKLSRRLLRGFTGQQLSKYYSITKGVKAKQVGQQVIAGLEKLQSQARRPAERSEWHPGTTQVDHRLPGLDVHRRSQRKAISKHLLVDQILRDLWKLVLLEEIEAPGELELLLKPWQLTLLSSGSGETPLDRIGKYRKAKIEIHWPHNVLRITADKNTAEYAADDIETILQKTERKQINLNPWIPYLDKNCTAGDLVDVISDKSLEAIASLTGAFVQKTGSQLLLIRALNKTACEEAERCLLRLLPIKDRATTTLDATRRDAAKNHIYLLPVTVEKSLLEFQARQLTLGRWSTPVTRTPAPTASSDGVGHGVTSQQTRHDEDLRLVQAQVSEIMKKSARCQIPPKGKRPGEHEWALAPEHRLVAQFGHVLFPLDHVHAGPQPMSAASFVPSLPGLAHILRDDDFEVRHRPGVPALEYTFVAAPEQQNFRKDQNFPSLHVKFRLNERTGQHMFHTLSLGFDERVHDVLLPDKSLDIRFFRHTRLRLREPNFNKMVEGFMLVVLANIQSGEKLSAPNIEIEIPKWTIPGFGQAHTPGTRKVKYLFTGIRFRQNVSATFMDNVVSISTMQSGKLGKKGASMSAFFNAQESPDGDNLENRKPNKNRLEKFVAGCFEIVDKITAAATGDKFESTQPKARHEFSARKIRRQTLFSQNDDSEELNAEQESTPAVQATTNEISVQSAPSPEEKESSTTLSQEFDMEDPYMSGFLIKESPSERHEESGIACPDTQDVTQDQEENRSLKAAA